MSTYPDYCCHQCGAQIGYLGRGIGWLLRRPLHRRSPKPAPKPELITFSADDNMMKRAANIWWALGYANDRLGAIPQIAGYLSMYREWDREESAETASSAPPVEDDEG